MMNMSLANKSLTMNDLALHQVSYYLTAGLQNQLFYFFLSSSCVCTFVPVHKYKEP